MARAQEHAENLKTDVSAFLDAQPYTIVHEIDRQTKGLVPPAHDEGQGVHIYRVHINQEIPDRIPIIAGEILQGMRSALDYVAWQLALGQSDTPPKNTAFPIFGKAKNYRTDSDRFIGGIDPSVHPTFDAVQPYHAGDKAFDHPLWVLHRLANDDKHKAPHVVGSVPSSMGIFRPDGADLFMGTEIGAFESGDIVGTIAISGGIEPERDLNPVFAFAIAFGKDTAAQGRPLFSEINRIGIEVDKVIKLFVRHAASPSAK